MITFVGDVHGWLDRLERVVAQSQGTIVFLGDLIDRGPQSREVVARVRELCTAGRAQCVMGNHEYAFIRALGVPGRGIPGDAALHDFWLEFYGGWATARSYGAAEGGEALRTAAAADLEWMVDLPWYLEGETEGHAYLVAHAGLSREPLARQLARMANAPERYGPEVELPEDLYAKNRVGTYPLDMPVGTTVVFGHVPLPEALMTGECLGVDTTGGWPGARLTGVIWPEGRIIRS